MSLTPATLLAVDDESPILSIFDMLFGADFILEKAQSGTELMDKLETITPAVVLLDIGLPDASGFDLCRRIKEDPRFNRTRVVMVSAQPGLTIRLQAYQAKADDYVLKPFDHKELKAKVQAYAKMHEIEARLQEQNSQLQEMADLKDRLLSEMSHEIRTPLTAMLGMTELLAESSLDPKQRQYIHVLQRSSQNLMAIVNQVLDHAKIERGQIQLESREIRLRELGEELLTLFQPMAQKKGLRWEWETADDVPPVVMGDGFRLRQALSNFIGNAIKFTTQGQVKVTVSKEHEAGRENGIVIAVTDTGMGIPADKQASIFSAFTQADQTVERRFGGTGLGLNISKKIIDAMGGTIAVSSQVGQGTSFVVRVPMRGMAEDKTASSGATHAVRRILVWEPHSRMQSSWRDLLGSRFDEVIMVDDVHQIIPTLTAVRGQENSYRAVVLAGAMDALADADVIRQIRKHRRLWQLPILTAIPDVPQKDWSRLGIGDQLTYTFLERTSPSEVLPRAWRWLDEKAASPFRVLIVEDDEDIRDYLAAIVEDFGVKVSVASSGKEALRILQESVQDMVLADIRMAEMDGLALLLHLRRMGADIPFIYVSGYLEKTNVLQGFRLGAFEMLEKPIKEDALFDALSRLLIKRPRLQTPVLAPLSVKDGQSRQILVLDDCEQTCFLYRVYLKPFQAQVHVAHTAEEAADFLRTQPIDLLVMDLNIPGINTRDFLQQLKASDPQKSVPVMMVTGDSEEQVRATLGEGELYRHYLRKPLRRVELVQAINELLKMPAEG